VHVRRERVVAPAGCNFLSGKGLPARQAILTDVEATHGASVRRGCGSKTSASGGGQLPSTSRNDGPPHVHKSNGADSCGSAEYSDHTPFLVDGALTPGGKRLPKLRDAYEKAGK